MIWEEYLSLAGSDNAALAKVLLAKVFQGDVAEGGRSDFSRRR